MVACCSLVDGTVRFVGEGGEQEAPFPLVKMEELLARVSRLVIEGSVSGAGVIFGDHSFNPLPVARSWISLFFDRNSFLSNKGKPHPHFSHFLSICCSHILCHTTSSSASDLHLWLTCAALHKDAVSKEQRILKDSSVGKAVRKSMRIKSRTLAER